MRSLYEMENYYLFGGKILTRLITFTEINVGCLFLKKRGATFQIVRGLTVCGNALHLPNCYCACSTDSGPKPRSIQKEGPLYGLRIVFITVCVIVLVVALLLASLYVTEHFVKNQYKQACAGKYRSRTFLQ